MSENITNNFLGNLSQPGNSHEERAQTFADYALLLNKALGGYTQAEIGHLNDNVVYFGIDVTFDNDFWLSENARMAAENMIDSAEDDPRTQGIRMIEEIRDRVLASKYFTPISVFIAGPDRTQVEIAITNVKQIISYCLGECEDLEVDLDYLISEIESSPGVVECYWCRMDVKFFTE